MTGPMHFQLEYQVFTDHSRQAPFGDGSNGSASVSLPASTVSTITAFGRVMPLQKVGAGAYSDSLLVTIHF